MQVGDERLKARESNLLRQLSPADKRAFKDCGFVEVSLQRQSALEKEVASPLDQHLLLFWLLRSTSSIK